MDGSPFMTVRADDGFSSMKGHTQCFGSIMILEFTRKRTLLAERHHLVTGLRLVNHCLAGSACCFHRPDDSLVEQIGR